MKKYIVVGGSPFTSYTGTTSFTGLSVVGHADSKEELDRLIKEHYESCGGLLLVIDWKTGLPAEGTDFGK
jgi:hypothetical protein